MVPKKTKHKYSRYTDHDYEYGNFVRGILKHLEPREVEEDTLLLNELDEILEVIFFTKGIHKAGYRLNKKDIFVNVYKADIKGHAIGTYGATFH